MTVYDGRRHGRAFNYVLTDGWSARTTRALVCAEPPTCGNGKCDAARLVRRALAAPRAHRTCLGTTTLRPTGELLVADGTRP